MRHLERHNIENKLPSTQADEEQLMCEVCQKIFSDYNSFEEHNNTHLETTSDMIIVKEENEDKPAKSSEDFEQSNEFLTVFVNTEENQEANVSQVYSNLFDTQDPGEDVEDPLSGKQNGNPHIQMSLPTNIAIKAETVDKVEEQVVQTKRLKTKSGSLIITLPSQGAKKHHQSSNKKSQVSEFYIKQPTSVCGTDEAKKNAGILSKQSSTIPKASIDKPIRIINVQGNQKHVTPSTGQSTIISQVFTRNPTSILKFPQTQNHGGLFNGQFNVISQDNASSPMRVFQVQTTQNQLRLLDVQPDTTSQTFYNNSGSILKVQKTPNQLSPFSVQSNVAAQSCTTNPTSVPNETQILPGLASGQCSLSAQASINNSGVVTLLPYLIAVPVPHHSQTAPALREIVPKPTVNIPTTNNVVSGNVRANNSSAGSYSEVMMLEPIEANELQRSLSKKQNDGFLVNHEPERTKERAIIPKFRTRTRKIVIDRPGENVPHYLVVQRQARLKRQRDERRALRLKQKLREEARREAQKNYRAAQLQVVSQESLSESANLQAKSIRGSCRPVVISTTDELKIVSNITEASISSRTLEQSSVTTNKDSNSDVSGNLQIIPSSVSESTVDLHVGEKNTDVSTVGLNINSKNDKRDVDSNITHTAKLTTSGPNDGMDTDILTIDSTNSESDVALDDEIRTVKSKSVANIDSESTPRVLCIDLETENQNGNSIDNRSMIDLEINGQKVSVINVNLDADMHDIDSETSESNTNLNPDEQHGNSSISRSKLSYGSNDDQNDPDWSDYGIAYRDQQCQVKIHSNISISSNTFTCIMYMNRDNRCDTGIQTELMSVGNDSHILCTSKCTSELFIIESDEPLFEIAGVTTKIFKYLLEALSQQDEFQIPKRKKLMIFLMIIKCGYSFFTAGAIFSIHHAIIEKIFFSVLSNLTRVLPALLYTRNEAFTNSFIQCFQKYDSRARLVIKSIQRKINIPHYPHLALFRYCPVVSSYVGKGYIAIDHTGLIRCQSRFSVMNETDASIIRECGMLDLIENGDLVLTDKKILGLDVMVSRVNVKDVEIQNFIPPCIDLHIEKIIQRLRSYDIMNNITENLMDSKDKIFHLCCILTNLNNL
ncbi:hypothetical protein QAD02_023243 [Eretmocerus hayati]|uniref:Uncharacterized protein n=1 Tax=Eretmocerus hayati TaxID=131215 RepID=A0ACC2PVX9_9HYME|nr:hypothetical protein QAD02_023243 [Eretmocerus hayati]